MKVRLVNSNVGFPQLERIGPEHIRAALFFVQQNARICQSQHSFERLSQEPFNLSLIESIIESGHHTPFEHVTLTFELEDIPKALAMVLNNEPPYSTSEKSARHRRMSGISGNQEFLYKKWKTIFEHEIDKIYPRIRDQKKRNSHIAQLAKENARYMTSAFANANMTYTTNWRQLNYLLGFFEEFQQNSNGCSLDFAQRVLYSMQDFSSQVSNLGVNGLVSKTDQHLSLFNPTKLEDYFEEVYSTSYLASFAAFAQAQRHRTIRHYISSGTEMGAPLGFFVPPIIKKARLESVWISDLKSVAENDYPQAQLVMANESATVHEFRPKAILRLCGKSQKEIQQITLETANKYRMYGQKYSISTPCAQGEYVCPNTCVWGKNGLERIV